MGGVTARPSGGWPAGGPPVTTPLQRRALDRPAVTRRDLPRPAVTRRDHADSRGGVIVPGGAAVTTRDRVRGARGGVGQRPAQGPNAATPVRAPAVTAGASVTAMYCTVIYVRAIFVVAMYATAMYVSDVRPGDVCHGDACMSRRCMPSRPCRVQCGMHCGPAGRG